MSLLCEGNTLKCCVCVESINSFPKTVKKEICKTAVLVIGRDRFSEPVLQINLGKSTRIYQLENIKVYRRFIKEGKSTLSLPTINVQLLISNCPPDQLLLFLRTLVAKLAKHRKKPLKRLTPRERLLTAAVDPDFTEVSPLCEQDLDHVRESCPTTTPTGGKTTAQRRPLKEKNNEERKVLSPFKKVRRTISLTNCLTELTVHQHKVLEAILSGRNVFFTGSAGTGKSFLLQRAIGSLAPEHTFATASTGVAASHICGMTLHSFAGIGSGKADLNKCIELASRSIVASQWRRCKHLIIDEISMISGSYFAKLEAVARVVRKCDKPFGGIHLIICGDFFQLPPVSKSEEKNERKPKFAFQTRAWKHCIDVTILLKEVKRQKDAFFIDVLNQVRRGDCPPSVTNILKSTGKNMLDKDGLEATRISTHNDDVEHINNLNLERLPGEAHIFTATDSDISMTKKLDDLSAVQKEITLKVGAQVMLCKNISTKEGLVNGTRGMVIGFEKSPGGFPIIRTATGKCITIKPEFFLFKWSGGINLTRRQLPVKLAWAISIHKSQGMTLDLVEITLSRAFECGQAYVALSRARTLQGLRVLNFHPDCVKVHPDVKNFYESLQEDH